MATVRLSNIINVTVFRDLEPVNSPELSALFVSGITVRTALLDQLTAAPGFSTELPFWNDLDADSEPNISSDDDTQEAGTDNVTQSEQKARKAFLNKGWSATDLASQVAMGANAMQHIRNRTDTYWTRQWQRRHVACAMGILMDNVANHSSDMVHDISTQDGDNATAANLFSRTAFVRATFTLGDAFENTGAIAVHSHVMEQMVENDQIDFIPDSEGNMTIPTFMGRRVITDDGMPVIAGTTSGMRYVSVLFGNGAFGYGETDAEVPVAVQREEGQGNGGGVEKLWTRKVWTIHPAGYQWTDTTRAEQGAASLAELRLPANWSRIVNRKNVPMAFLITN